MAKFTAGVIDTDGAPSLANISENFQKFQNEPIVIFKSWGGGGK
jgi:hypothetical protein